MVTPKFLALVFPVRIGAAQQRGLQALFTKNPGQVSRGRVKAQQWPFGEIGIRAKLKILYLNGVPVRFRQGPQPFNNLRRYNYVHQEIGTFEFPSN